MRDNKFCANIFYGSMFMLLMGLIGIILGYNSQLLPLLYTGLAVTFTCIIIALMTYLPDCFKTPARPLRHFHRNQNDPVIVVVINQYSRTRVPNVEFNRLKHFSLVRT
jgi:hypothetical protein